MGGLVSIVSYSRPSLVIIASRTQFHVERPFSIVAISVITNLRMDLFEALVRTVSASNPRPLQKPELNAKEMRMILNWRLQQQAKEEQRVNVTTTGNNQNITKT